MTQSASKAARTARRFSPEPLTLSSVSITLGGKSIIKDLDLAIGKGEMVCLLGPSGCGKTTTLRMIGGFLTPDAGRITVGERDVTSLPPERRPSAMVFQNYALWPHMSVEKNVAFPLKVAKVPRDERTARVREALALVGLEEKAGRRPARLSGGEQQRVALARALVQNPSLLLLDEPLSNLDAKLRVQVREEIRRIQQELGMTSVFVTHDQEEALAVADRIAVMNGGRIEQLTDPTSLYRRPATRFVAGFIGTMSFVEGRVERRADGSGRIYVEGLEPLPIDLVTGAAEHAECGIRPENVVIGDPRAAQLKGTIERITPKGHLSDLVVRVGAIRVRSLAKADDLRVGDEVGVRITEALVYRDGVLVDAATSPAGPTGEQSAA